MPRTIKSSETGGDVQVASFDFLLAVFEQPDIVVLAASVVEDSAGVESEEALAASVIGSDVLVHHDELENGAVAGAGGEGEGLVPGDGLLLVALDDLGLEFGGLSGAVVGLDLNVVFHTAEPVLALVQDCVSDGDFDLGHI